MKQNLWQYQREIEYAFSQNKSYNLHIIEKETLIFEMQAKQGAVEVFLRIERIAIRLSAQASNHTR